jgi:glycosyltransferase involved in cell wall biosynthesis
MPTADRRHFVPRAIYCFLEQDYPQKELVIVDDGADSVRGLVPNDRRIRYFRTETRKLVGAKRNFACREVRGEVIVHWDDDDWSASWRLSYQVEQLQESQPNPCDVDRRSIYARLSKGHICLGHQRHPAGAAISGWRGTNAL